MFLRATLDGLVKKVKEAEGTDDNGAVRDIFTDLIHVARTLGLDPEFIFKNALIVANEEEKDAAGR